MMDGDMPGDGPVTNWITAGLKNARV